MKRILLSWSSGKDSAWSLHVLRQRGEYEVVGLLTTFNQVADRVAMHAVRRDLVERQAAAVGLPLWSVPLPWPCSNEQYESLMAQTCVKAIAENIEGEVTLRESCRVYDDVTFRPRHAVSITTCNLRTRVLGFDLALPFLLAPVGY